MERHIIISESQYKLLEKLVKEDGALLDNGDVKEYGNPSQIGTSAQIHNTDGKVVPGKDVAADEYGKEQSYQGYWGNTRARY